MFLKALNYNMRVYALLAGVHSMHRGSEGGKVWINVQKDAKMRRSSTAPLALVELSELSEIVLLTPHFFSTQEFTTIGDHNGDKQHRIA